MSKDTATVVGARYSSFWIRILGKNASDMRIVFSSASSGEFMMSSMLTIL